MYQLGTKWILWDLSRFTENETNKISIRGYDLDSVNLPADLYSESTLDQDGQLIGLSVAHISSGYCPEKRDLYLEKKERIKAKKTHRTWGRIAGLIIEQYFEGIIEYFADLARKPNCLSYKRIQNLADEYSKNFWTSKEDLIERLGAAARTDEESPDRLIFSLRQTTKYELSQLAIDYELNKKMFKRFVPLTERVPIEFGDKQVQIRPHKNLGLSRTNTPDFLILNIETVIGEVKTGKHIETKHLDTIAGYALAYESQHHTNVNFGIVYFFETHVRQLSFSQSYIFIIDNFFRRKFLDSRNSAYKILLRDQPPKLADYDKYCKFCKYVGECYSNQHDNSKPASTESLEKGI